MAYRFFWIWSIIIVCLLPEWSDAAPFQRDQEEADINSEAGKGDLSLAEIEKSLEVGKHLDNAGQYREALARYEIARQFFQQEQDAHREAEVLSEMAVIYRKLGDFETSLAFQHSAIRMYVDLGDQNGQSKALRRLGVLARYQGKLFEAISYYQDALELLTRLQDQDGIAQVLTNLGIVYSELGRLQEALQYFTRVLAIYTELRNESGVSYTLGNLGQLSLYLGNSQQALEYLSQSLTLKQSSEDIRGQANTLLNMGTAHKNLGDFQKALTCYYQALDVYTQLNDLPGKAAVLGSIGSCYEELGDVEQAWRYQEESLRFKKLSGTSIQLSIALTNLASLAIKQQRFIEADAYLQEALTIAIEHNSFLSQANIYGQLGMLALSQQAFPQASEYFSRSLTLYEKIGSQKGILEALTFIGQTYISQYRFQDAAPYFERALQLARELQDMNSLWIVQYYLGEITLHVAQPERALPYFQAAIQTLEQMRNYLQVSELRRSFLQKDRNPYVQMIHLLLERGEYTEALWYLERFKARTFLEVVAYGEPQLHEAPILLQEEKELLTRIRLLSERLSAAPDALQPEFQISEDLQQELYQAKEQYEQLLLRIKLQYPEYYRLKTVDAEEIEHLVHNALTLLEDDVSILEYFLDDDRVHIWVLTRDQVYYESFPAAYTTVIDHVLRFRTELGNYESTKIFTSLQELYTCLVSPVEKYLTHTRIVGIVPFEILHFVPFGALVRQQEDGNPAYFIEQYAVFMLPSLSMLPIVRERSQRNARYMAASPMRSILGMANAVENLPGVEEEIAAILSQFPDSQGYIGNEATEQRLFNEARQYEMIHLATHGVFDKQHPMFSYLEFASKSYLYARDIFGLQLECSLVTLSGCETFLPQQIEVKDIHTLVSGDELVGFIRAFMYAGTPSILASLWRVNDTATQYLMSAFYQNLSESGKARALQQAARSVMRTTLHLGRRKKREIELVHPFFWSSFVLIGDWK
ncbi:tetratricopeptide repeat domain protein [Candidatus Vecturithrix granuli]|uniref:Tetratricopeptide repeat domain protein n=1 Tax=Vecturithrix granuli TaxID=1499967 RepID=A0A081C2R5_VECG1|nr:tetratricopeptide repeat domain protein [Candidatus Vecturithrix granuli]